MRGVRATTSEFVLCAIVYLLEEGVEIAFLLTDEIFLFRIVCAL